MSSGVMCGCVCVQITLAEMREALALRFGGEGIIRVRPIALAEVCALLAMCKPDLPLGHFPVLLNCTQLCLGAFPVFQTVGSKMHDPPVTRRCGSNLGTWRFGRCVPRRRPAKAVAAAGAPASVPPPLPRWAPAPRAPSLWSSPIPATPCVPWCEAAMLCKTPVPPSSVCGVAADATCAKPTAHNHLQPQPVCVWSRCQGA